MRTVLIVDDHDGFRSWAREVLRREGFRVVGTAEDGRRAIDAVHQLHPDVVLLDVQLPDMSGFDVADEVGDDAIVVLTSSRSAADYGHRVASSSATAFIAKDELTGARLYAEAFGDRG